MEVVVISWKEDGRWSADKETLDAINKMIQKNQPKPKSIFKRIINKFFNDRFL